MNALDTINKMKPLVMPEKLSILMMQLALAKRTYLNKKDKVNIPNNLFYKEEDRSSYNFNGISIFQYISLKGF